MVSKNKIFTKKLGQHLLVAGLALNLAAFSSVSAQTISPTNANQPVNANGPVSAPQSNIVFINPSAGAKLSGAVTLTAQASPDVQRVQFKTVVSGTEGPAELGTLDPLTGYWNYTWDTTQLLNGVYDLKVEGLDGPGQLLATSNITIEIGNSDTPITPPDQPARVPVEISTLAPKDQEIIFGNVYLLAKSNIALTGLNFNLESVPPLAPKKFSGKAKLASTDTDDLTWTFGLETNQFMNGHYKLTAQSVLGQVVFNSPVVNIDIENSAEKVLGQVKITQPSADEPLTALTNLAAVADAPADLVEFRIRPIEPADQRDNAKTDEIITATLSDNGSWTAEWDTSHEADGDYSVSAVAQKGSLIIESSILNLKILNQPEDPVQINLPKTIKTSPVAIGDLKTFKVRLTETGESYFVIDSDGDGLTDDQEARFGSDPTKADTDGDKFDDAHEILNGYSPSGDGRFLQTVSPLDRALAAKAPIQEPSSSGTQSDNLKIVNVIPGDENQGLVFGGQAPANQTIALFIYGPSPLVITASADSTGQWRSSLNQNLTDGAHQIVAVTMDDAGHVINKSAPFNIVVNNHQLLSDQSVISSTGLYAGPFVKYLMGGSFSALGLIALLLTNMIYERKVSRNRPS